MEVVDLYTSYKDIRRMLLWSFSIFTIWQRFLHWWLLNISLVIIFQFSASLTGGRGWKMTDWFTSKSFPHCLHLRSLARQYSEEDKYWRSEQFQCLTISLPPGRPLSSRKILKSKQTKQAPHVYERFSRVDNILNIHALLYNTRHSDYILFGLRCQK